MNKKTVVLTGAAGTVIGGVALDLLGLVNFKAVATSAWAGIVKAWEWLGASASIPHWLLVLLSLSGLICVLVPLVAFISSTRAETNSMFDRFSYVEDTFHGVRWRWGWGRNGSIDGISAFCPRCDLQIVAMVHDGFSPTTKFSCRECKVDWHEGEGNWYQVSDQIRMLIQRTLRRRAQEAASATAPPK
ncbi:MAG TPA: hypothetical protein VMF52_20005 [Steroidobacteraceae bacterium]|nr:hypothetical protein [Steroidobacteraceae bacterium]